MIDVVGPAGAICSVDRLSRALYEAALLVESLGPPTADVVVSHWRVSSDVEHGVVMVSQHEPR